MITGVGIDLVDHERVKTMMERVGAERVLARLLTEGERDYCARMRNPYPHIAVRLAAKEAGFKALAGDIEARAIAWQEMEVVHDEHRRPTLRLHGRASIEGDGVRVGGATGAAPPSTAVRVAASQSSTSSATRKCPATREPTSTSSIMSACAEFAISSVALPASRIATSAPPSPL